MQIPFEEEQLTELGTQYQEALGDLKKIVENEEETGLKRIKSKRARVKRKRENMQDSANKKSAEGQ